MSTVAPSIPTSLASPVQVKFQLGLFREEVRVPAGNLSYRHAKRLATDIIEHKVRKTLRLQAVCPAAAPKHSEDVTRCK